MSQQNSSMSVERESKERFLSEIEKQNRDSRKNWLAETAVDSLEVVLTGLLFFGSTRGFVGLTPDSDAVLQKLQCPTLLPVS